MSKYSEEQDNMEYQAFDQQVSLEYKRIIIVLWGLELGGTERQALLLARLLLSKARANVEIWGLDFPIGRAARLCDKYGITWRIVRVKWQHTGLRRLRDLYMFVRELRKVRPDIILSYIGFPNVVCGLIWR